jgi:hypothetical protein
MRPLIIIVFLCKGVLLGAIPNPSHKVDTTLIKIVDVTGDGVPDSVFLHMRSANFYAPFDWTLSIKLGDSIIYSYREADSSTESYFDFDSTCNSHYIECKYDYYFNSFVGLKVDPTFSIIYDGKDKLLEEDYSGSIYHCARAYLIKEFHFDTSRADEAIRKMVEKIKRGKAIVIQHNDGPFLSTQPMAYFAEVNRFVPIYSW